MDSVLLRIMPPNFCQNREAVGSVGTYITKKEIFPGYMQ